MQSVGIIICWLTALNGEVTIEGGGEFIRECVDINEYNIPFVKGIALIHKVREVEALVAFSRLEPLDSESSEQDGKILKISIKEPDTNWYPGYDVRGEGIFIEFDEEAIDRWRTNNLYVNTRVAQINENYKKSYYGSKKEREITSKFLLIHTISHLLMKQLSFECGYNIASLKERLYCSEEKEGKCMAGIFIYTASGDSEGTMGGLVRQGRHDTFPTIFRKAITSALTCSNDPVCSLSMGQGRDSLNLSACYSCTLVPETSCEEFNVFLDRGVVVGTFEHPEFGFYSNYTNSGESITYKSKNGMSMCTNDNIDKKIIVTEYGADLCGVSFDDIWKSLVQFSENKHEIENLNELIKHSREIEQIEKPFQSGAFQIGFDNTQYDVDLIWKEKKIMIFSEGNREEYEIAAKSSEWKSILLSNEHISFSDIIKTLEE